MRQRELSRLFRQIVMASVPIPLDVAASSCSGQAVNGGGDASVSGSASTGLGGFLA